MEHEMCPFIELGFKPNSLMRSLEHPIIAEEQKILFQSLAQYRDTLYELVIHCVNRYGVDEVGKWYFEQWGDPRITSGEGYGEYFDVFETAYQTLKAVSMDIRIGGAGFGRLYSMLDFQGILKLWKKRKYQPDFISLYGYPYMARGNQKSQNDDRIRDPSFVNSQVMMMREVLKGLSMHIPELFITEWSSSVSDWNSLNDSVYKGAFMLKSMIDNVGCLDMMGYWQASDLLSEYYDTGMLLHGGNGLLSADGICKPAFYALQFAGRLGKMLLGRSENAMITADGPDHYYIACHNYAHPNFKYYLKQEDETEPGKQFLLFDDARTVTYKFQIRNVKNGRYMIKIRSLNEDHGSVQDEWGEMGYSENLSRQDIAYLKKISTPKISLSAVVVTDHVLEIDTKLKVQEIQLLHVSYQME